MTGLPEAPPKWVCEECGAVTADFLRAPHPFITDPGFEVHGCPTCLEINTLVSACQIGECKEKASSGTSGAYGFRYVWTCWKHSPSNPKSKQEGEP